MVSKYVSGLFALAAAQIGISNSQAEPLVFKSGDTAKIPRWDLQTSSRVQAEPQSLSRPGVDTSDWHHVPVSKCTLMACLIETGVYKEDELWYSDNLNHVDWGMFKVPFFYRHEFSLRPKLGQHFILKTHGITSGADIYVNGEAVGNQSVQSGSFSGQNYDITGLVEEKNALLIKAYPTDYYQDLALGFIDWNPRPSDNGSGIWRDIEVRQTGPVFLETVSALVDIDPGSVTLRAKIENLEKRTVKVTAEALILEPDGGRKYNLKKTLSLKPTQKATVDFKKIFDNPKLWWPRQWGKQPLYKAKINLSVDSKVSDIHETTFGLRSVTSKLNKDEDILFSVNGHPFQVRGAGYAPDMFMRWDAARFETIARYMLDMGLNTIRLEGHMEHPELYEITDRLGLLVMAGYQCCNKW
jgi:exo-1,4-beta-D-glucosaminidase